MRGVLSGGKLLRCVAASSSTERTTSSLRSLISRVTPEEAYAAGIVSCASQAPLANCEKSVHAATVVSIQCTSTTFSGGHSAGGAGSGAGAGAEVWAVLTAGRTANSINTNEARDIGTNS